ncbi:MAG: hypothetical protein WCR36_01480 [Bacteroidaceae bacterium]
MRNFITFTLALLLSLTVSAQKKAKSSSSLIYGYEKVISSTEDIIYQSHLSSEGHAMIVRMSRDNQKMVWLSQPLPKTITTENITLVWITGFTGLAYTKPGEALLSVNGKEVGTFTTAEKYAFSGLKGTNLSFHEKMRDLHGDCFGFM